ncbi:MAG: ParB/RepB/Spo0J family partition protein [Kiritimatiellae bacterium]|nr:ParB/RepB/Spo0J family partition protein [Kiritimatiellia bacterium]
MSSKNPYLKKATGAAKAPAQAGKKSAHGLQGRGLDALLSQNAKAVPTHVASPVAESASAASKSAVPAVKQQEIAPKTGLVELKILDIERSPYQPRRDFKEDELKELADSIRNNGLVQPPTVRKNKEGRYELIAGERRLRAALIAGWSKIKVNLIEADDLTAAAMTATENLQREDLNPIEEAVSYKTLLDTFSLTQQEVADKVGKGRATVANALRLLELPDEVRQMVEERAITVGHAKILLSLDDEKTRTLFARDVVNDQLTVLALQRKVERYKSPVPEKPRGVPDLTDAYIRNLQDAMRRHLGCAVRIKSGITHLSGRHVKGLLEIDFYDNDDLDRIIRMIGVTVE